MCVCKCARASLPCIHVCVAVTQHVVGRWAFSFQTKYEVPRIIQLAPAPMLKHSQQGLITSQQEGERGEAATTEGKQRWDSKAGKGLCEGRAVPWKRVRNENETRQERGREVERQVQS